ncbi:MAG: hypothetical protein M3040_06830 [Bacteroidota bacterium]|nr:hypothetical protein [Bacteroidota bacterium]
MAEDEEFYITYEGRQVKVLSIINGGNIYFIVQLATPVIIAEGLVGEDWGWYEVGVGATSRSVELGEIIERMEA